MKISRIDDYFKGWFIGNFDPAVLKTDQFEVGVLFYPKGIHHQKHFHRLATEYNVLVQGSFILSGTKLNAGDVFILEPDEIADPEFLEDCTIVCVKVPSLPGDKYEIYD